MLNNRGPRILPCGTPLATGRRPDKVVLMHQDGLSTGLTNTHMACGFSDLYHLFARKLNNLCSVMVALHHHHHHHYYYYYYYYYYYCCFYYYYHLT